MRIVNVLLCAIGCMSCSAAQGVERPNIVILLADDLGYGELGCQGNPQIPTPHIDSIAGSGIRFTQAYVTGPNCSPSRAGLLTGKIPTRFGYEFNPIGPRNEDPAIGLPAAEQTLAELLHDHGYTTGLIGKWHLGGAAAYHPLRHGFDEFFGFTHEGHYFTPPPHQAVTTMLRRKSLPSGELGRWRGTNLIFSTHMGHDEPAYDANNPILRQGQPVDEQAYLTDAFAREAVSFIERHRALPFFLMVAFNAVHSPLQAKNSDLQKFGSIEDDHRRIFAGMLTSLDDAVEQVLNTLEATGTARNTLLVFLSDNGGPTRELTSSNLPLRGEKGSMYEGALRVPFMLQWPSRLPGGQVYDQPISSTDLFATAAVIAGAKLEHSIDGRDLIPYVSGQATGQPHTEFFWRQGERSALRHGDWKIIRSARNGKVQWELYNLERDLSETHDLSAMNAPQLARMQARWEAFNAQMREPLF
jgi:arylsulfatase A-like enzyme